MTLRRMVSFWELARIESGSLNTDFLDILDIDAPEKLPVQLKVQDIDF